MEKLNFKIIIPIALLSVATFVIGPACSAGPEPAVPYVPPPCVTTNTDFQNLIATVKSSDPAVVDIVSVDLLVHEYTFKVSKPKEICSIGYQGNVNMFSNNLPYQIQLVNASGQNVMSTPNNIVFDNKITDYKGNRGTLTPGNLYTLRRLIPANGFLNDLGNTTGRILKIANTTVTFPITSGDMTIVSSNFYDTTGGNFNNYAIPFIDIVFE